MGRPLKKEYINAITVHYAKEGKVKEGKLLKQVGFNKYIVEAGDTKKGILPFVVRLVAKETFKDKKLRENGMGYVTITHAKDGEKSLAKLTKNLIVCTDGSTYAFEYTLDTSVENEVKVLSKKDASVAIEGFSTLVVEEEEQETEVVNDASGDSSAVE